jgi:hypothetical protein
LAQLKRHTLATEARPAGKVNRYSATNSFAFSSVSFMNIPTNSTPLVLAFS